MTALDAETAIRVGGWDPRFARALALAERAGKALAVIDSNGDGAGLRLTEVA